MVGSHDGIARYTVGQGKRLGAAAIAGGERQVVVALDPARRRVVVGPRMPAPRMVRLREVNWLDRRRRAAALHGEAARTRSAAAGDWCTRTEDGAEVLLDAPALPAPGQACVFYDGERVLGGGFIRRADAAAAVDAAGRRSYLRLPLRVRMAA